jgi:parvulin-like peptidyl-prolyl isomerase
MKFAPLAIVLTLTACGSAQSSVPTEHPEGAKQEESSTSTSTASPPPTTAATPTPTPTETSSSTGPKSKPTKISAAHVLIQYMGSERAPSSVVRTREQARAVAEKVLERARAGEDFSRLAVEMSDEPGAAQRGGSLGRFGHGQMVRAFEDAAFALDVGQVSDIVETPFGFHIIKRTE